MDITRGNREKSLPRAYYLLSLDLDTNDDLVIHVHELVIIRADLSIPSKFIYRRVAEIQIFEKTYPIVIKNETGLKFKINDSTLFLIGSYAQKMVASY